MRHQLNIRLDENPELLEKIRKFAKFGIVELAIIVSEFWMLLLTETFRNLRTMEQSNYQMNELRNLKSIWSNCDHVLFIRQYKTLTQIFRGKNEG
jgi:hypothetical protein